MDVHILINMIEMVYPDIKIKPDQDYDDDDCTLYHPHFIKHLTKTDYELDCDIIANDCATCIAFDFGFSNYAYSDYLDKALLLDFKTRVEKIFKLVPFYDNDDVEVSRKKYAVIDINPDYKV